MFHEDAGDVSQLLIGVLRQAGQEAERFQIGHAHPVHQNPFCLTDDVTCSQSGFELSFGGCSHQGYRGVLSQDFAHVDRFFGEGKRLVAEDVERAKGSTLALDKEPERQEAADASSPRCFGKRRPARIVAHVIYPYGVVLSQRRQTWPVVKLGLQLVELSDPGTGRDFCHHRLGFNERDTGPACPRDEPGCRIDNPLQDVRRCGLGLQFDGKVTEGPGQVLVTGIHNFLLPMSAWRRNALDGIREPQRGNVATVTSDHNNPDPRLERVYQELLKALPLRGNVEVAATRSFRPLTVFFSALPPSKAPLLYENDLSKRCQRAIDQARRLCDTAKQTLSTSAATLRPSLGQRPDDR